MTTEPAPPEIKPESSPNPALTDRAALEAAIAGAAGLLLGRLLLGRGAGLLAGSAAIAARVVADLRSSKTASPAAPETSSPEAAHAPVSPVTSSPPEPAISASGTPDQTVPGTTAAAPAFPENWSAVDESIPPSAEPAPDTAPQPPSPAPWQSWAETAPPAPARTDSARIFTDPGDPPSPPGSAPPAETTALPPLSIPASARPLSDFPFQKLAADSPPSGETSEAPGAVPSPIASTALPGFPGVPETLPDPDTFWKQAAEETAPDETSPVSNPFVVAPPPPPGTLPQLRLAPSPADNPFAALVAAPSTPSPESAPVPPPEEPAEPAADSRDATDPFLRDGEDPWDSEPAQPGGTLDPAGEAPPALPATELPAMLPETFRDVPSFPETLSPPPISSTATPDPDEVGPEPAPDPPAGGEGLPVIWLKAPSSRSTQVPLTAPVPPPPPETPSSAAAPESEDVSRPVPRIFEPLPRSPNRDETEEESAPVSSVAPEEPRRRLWPWVLILIIAALLALLYRHEIRKSADSGDVRPANSGTALPASPAFPYAPVTAAPGLVPVPAQVVPAADPQESAPAPLPPAGDNQPADPVPPETGPGPAPEAAAARESPPQLYTRDSPAGQARQVLESLLRAKSPEELNPLVFLPEQSVRRAQQLFPDGDLQPRPWQQIVLDASRTLPDSNLQAHLFRVRTDEVPAGFPVSVEETASGLRIDYEAFVQCRDRLLDAFMDQPAAGSETFLVVLRRGHYFGNRLSPEELERLICFEVASPNPAAPRHPVFVLKESVLGEQVLRQFVWDKNYLPVVQLTHGNKYVSLTEVVKENWRRAGF